MSETKTTGLVAAYVILGKMLRAAQAAGDVGRAFVMAGVCRMLGQELESRRSHCTKAQAIAAEAHTVDQLIAEALTDRETPGVIDPTEASVIRAHCRKGEREAEQLAEDLKLPEQKLLEVTS